MRGSSITSPSASARKPAVHTMLSMAAAQESAGGPSLECLLHPVDESLDALAYSVAWYSTESACARYASTSQEAALETIPRLVAGRPTNFDDCLRFCRSLFHGTFKIVSEAVRSRLCALDPDALGADFVSRVALRIVVDSAIDVMTLLSSRRDAVASDVYRGPQPQTPSKALSASSPPSSPSFVSFRRTLDGEGVDLGRSRDALLPSSSMSAPTSGAAVLSMAALLTPCTLINLLSCAFMDSLVALAVTDVEGGSSSRRRNSIGATTRSSGIDVDSGEAAAEAEEAGASNAFFVMSMVVGTDPDDLLDKFVEYARAAPYPIRRIWAMELGRGGDMATVVSGTDTGHAIRGRRGIAVPADVVATTWASTSRRLVLQRSVVGMLLESAGPSLAHENAAVAQLWRYASSA